MNKQQTSSTQETKKKPLETKNKKIILSIADLIAISLFLVSLGTSIGFFLQTMDDIGEVKDDLKSTSNDVVNIRVSLEGYKTSMNNIDKNVTRLMDKSDKN